MSAFDRKRKKLFGSTAAVDDVDHNSFNHHKGNAASVWYPGSRPLKKLITGDAAQYLPFAMKKLADLHRNPAKILSTNVIVDGVSISVQKLDALDIIKIQGGNGWMASSYIYYTGVNGFPAYLYENARTSGPGSRWDAETSQLLVEVSASFVIESLRHLSPIVVLGDGRYTYSYRSVPTHLENFNVGATIYSARSSGNETIVGGVAYAEPIIDSQGHLRPTYYAAPELNSDLNPTFVWRKNPLRYEDITLQAAVCSTSWIDFPLYTPRFTLMDVDYPVYYPDVQLVGGGQKPLLDVGIQGTDVGNIQTPGNQFYGPWHAPYPVFLTPDRILISTIPMGTYTTPSIGQFDDLHTVIYSGVAASVDGGVTWTLGSAPSLVIDLPNMAGRDTWAPISANEALWCATRSVTNVITTSNGIQVDNYQYVWSVMLVTIDGAITLLKDFETYPASTGVYTMQLYSVGQNCVVAALAILDVNAPPSPSLNLRLHFSRSYDRGQTWDAPVDSGYNYYTGFNDVGYPAIQSGQALLAGVPYPYKAYIPNVDPGIVYMPLTIGDYNWPQYPYGLPTIDNQYSVLMKSVDQCRTWQQTSQISRLPANEYSTVGSLFSYQAVADLTAPMDPIFPWRVDARVTPPAWWMN